MSAGKRYALAAGCLLVAGGWAGGDIIVRDAAAPADVEARRAEWLADCGMPAPSCTVDFESGFIDGQNISGVEGLFPARMVIRDTTTAARAVIRSGTAFGGSRPNGVFGVAHNEGRYLELEFPFGVDAVALADIDHTGTVYTIHHLDGSTSTYTTESAGAAEFVGFYRNDRPPIVRVQMDASGDGTWGIDDIQYMFECKADFTGDGRVDFSDYLEFLNYYELQDPRVDFNEDGLVDFVDYLEYLNMYDAGC
ncbi:MAG: EF-hand domain-containing protein [Phycisphaerales bacterium]|nr:EF-hand domain-containing protein [Phycisphaerales bacterium]